MTARIPTRYVLSGSADIGTCPSESVVTSCIPPAATPPPRPNLTATLIIIWMRFRNAIGPQPCKGDVRELDSIYFSLITSTYLLSIFDQLSHRLPLADHSVLCVARIMAILRRVALLFAAVALLLRFDSVQGTFEGTLECEELTALECAFAVSSAGARCVLEKSTLLNGDVIPICQTSTILAERPAEWIESDECISACGLERQTYGLSTDSLMDSSTVDKLCSADCQSNCPNIIDIYFKLAVGEGVYLPRLCNENKFNARRVLISRNGPQADQGGGPFWSSTHKHSLASAGTPAPQPSPASPVTPVYTAPLFPGLYLPAPPVPYHIPKKGKKPLVISPAPGPSPSPAPVPVARPYQAPSLLPEPISQASSVGFSNDFEDVDY